MSMFPINMNVFKTGILSKPGDKLSAVVTPTGKQVIKIRTSDIKRTLVKHPNSEIVVETIVHKPR